MASWREIEQDPRSTAELFATALRELDEDPAEYSAPSALVALQARPTLDVVERAIEFMGSSDSDERLLGVHVLAELREGQGGGYVPAHVDRSVTALLDCAELEFDDEILAQIARALGYRQDPRGLPILLEWLDHDDERIRFHVARALPSCATIETEDVVAKALVQLTRDDDADVRDYALFGFPQLTIDTPEIRDAILACTRDEDWSTAGQALVNLAMLGDQRVIEPLIAYIEAGRRGPNGYTAAAAIADPALLPSLQSAIPIHGHADELARAITACETRTPQPAWE